MYSIELEQEPELVLAVHIEFVRLIASTYSVDGVAHISVSI